MADNILRLTVKSTHFYLLDCLGGKLLVDAGWELPAFLAQLRVYQVPIATISWVMFTHHHPDHAGLVQDIRDRSGAGLIIHEKQIPYLENLRAYFAKKGGYNPIRVEAGDRISPDRAALAALGVRGEIVETPGHSDDSISLVLDSGVAFIGDLTAPGLADPESAPLVTASWRRLLERGVRTFYHSHTNPIPAEQVRAML